MDRKGLHKDFASQPGRHPFEAECESPPSVYGGDRDVGKENMKGNHLISKKSKRENGRRLSLKSIETDENSGAIKLVLQRDAERSKSTVGGMERLKEKLGRNTRTTQKSEVPLKLGKVRVGMKVQLRSSYNKKKRDFVEGVGKVSRDDKDGFVLVEFENGVGNLYEIKDLVHAKSRPSSLRNLRLGNNRLEIIDVTMTSTVCSSATARNPSQEIIEISSESSSPSSSKSSSSPSKKRSASSRKIAPMFAPKMSRKRTNRSKPNNSNKSLKVGTGESSGKIKVAALFTRVARGARRSRGVEHKQGENAISEEERKGSKIKNPYSKLPKAKIFLSRKEKQKLRKEREEQAFKQSIEESRKLNNVFSKGKDAHWFLKPRKFTTISTQGAGSNSDSSGKSRGECVVWPCPLPSTPHALPVKPTDSVLGEEATADLPAVAFPQFHNKDQHDFVPMEVAKMNQTMPMIVKPLWRLAPMVYGNADDNNKRNDVILLSVKTAQKEEENEKKDDPSIVEIHETVDDLLGKEEFSYMASLLAQFLEVEETEILEQLTRFLRLREKSYSSGFAADKSSGSQESSNSSSISSSNSSSGNCSERKLFEKELWADVVTPSCDEWSKHTRSVKSLSDWLKQNWIEAREEEEEQDQHRERQQRCPLRESDEDYCESDDFEDEGYRIHRSGRLHGTSSVLLYGPCGSGKTASVYSCSRKFGLNVLEINTSQVRSGAHLAKLCKEATQSHLLRLGKRKKGGVASPISLLDEDEVVKEVDSDGGARGKRKIKRKRMKTMKLKNKKGGFAEYVSSSSLSPSAVSSSTATRSSSQTLILFDEVDKVFSSDNGFFRAIASLTAETKRPIVITCNEVPPELRFASMTKFHIERPTFLQSFRRLFLASLSITGFPDLYTLPPSSSSSASSQKILSASERLRRFLQGRAFEIAELLHMYGRDIRRVVATLQLWLPLTPLPKLIDNIEKVANVEGDILPQQWRNKGGGKLWTCSGSAAAIATAAATDGGGACCGGMHSAILGLHGMNASCLLFDDNEKEEEEEERHAIDYDEKSEGEREEELQQKQPWRGRLPLSFSSSSSSTILQEMASVIEQGLSAGCPLFHLNYLQAGEKHLFSTSTDDPTFAARAGIPKEVLLICQAPPPSLTSKGPTEEVKGANNTQKSTVLLATDQHCNYRRNTPLRPLTCWASCQNKTRKRKTIREDGDEEEEEDEMEDLEKKGKEKEIKMTREETQMITQQHTTEDGGGGDNNADNDVDDCNQTSPIPPAILASDSVAPGTSSHCSVAAAAVAAAATTGSSPLTSHLITERREKEQDERQGRNSNTSIGIEAEKKTAPKHDGGSIEICVPTFSAPSKKEEEEKDEEKHEEHLVAELKQAADAMAQIDRGYADNDDNKKYVNNYSNTNSSRKQRKKRRSRSLIDDGPDEDTDDEITDPSDGDKSTTTTTAAAAAAAYVHVEPPEPGPVKWEKPEGFQGLGEDVLRMLKQGAEMIGSVAEASDLISMMDLWPCSTYGESETFICDDPGEIEAKELQRLKLTRSSATALLGDENGVDAFFEEFAPYNPPELCDTVLLESRAIAAFGSALSFQLFKMSSIPNREEKKKMMKKRRKGKRTQASPYPPTTSVSGAALEANAVRGDDDESSCCERISQHYVQLRGRDYQPIESLSLSVAELRTKLLISAGSGLILSKYAFGVDEIGFIRQMCFVESCSREEDGAGTDARPRRRTCRRRLTRSTSSRYSNSLDKLAFSKNQIRQLDEQYRSFTLC